MKLIRRIFTFSAILLLLLVSGTFVFVNMYGDEIKSSIIASLNEKLNSKVDVSEVDISFWNEFPSASLSFKNVVIYSSLTEGDTLISSQALNASFDLLKFYNKNYELTGLSLYKGKCSIQVDEKGNANYLIFKSDSSTEKKFKVTLEKLRFEDVSFSFHDQYNDVNLDFYFKKGRASGAFTDSIYDLKVETDLLNCHLISNDWEIIQNRQVSVNGVCEINDVLNSISFSNTVLSIESFDFEVNGSIDYSNTTELELSIVSKNQNLKNAISVMPPKIKTFLSDYSINGEAIVTGSIQGAVGKKVNPSYQFQFDLKNGEFSKNDGSVAFNNAIIKGSIDNGSNNSLKSTSLSIKQFNSDMLNGKVVGSLNLIDFTQPSYDLNATVDLDLAEIISFVKTDQLMNSQGKINASFNLKGKMDDTEGYDISDFKSAFLKGNLDANDLSFDEKSSGYSFENVNGSMNFERNQIELENLSFSINQQDAKIQGKLINLIPYASDKKERLIADIVLSSNHLDVNQFMTNETEKQAFSLPENITLYLKNNIQELEIDRLKLNAFRSNLFISHDKVDVRDCYFETLEGSVEGDFFLKKTPSGFQFVTANRLNEVNISKLFDSFNDFGQSTIKSKNISGVLSADVHANLRMDSYLNVAPASIKMDANFLVNEGRLKNVKALEAFSNHIDLNELKDIKFQSLQNQIYIEKEKLFIPKMTVLSSALELSLYGEHTFKNEINYHFVLLLNEILGKKVKRPQSNEFGYVKDDGLGRTKIFVKMQGTVEKPEFSYDSKALKKHLKGEVNTEKKTIKKLLNEEFGLFKNDSSYQDVKLETPVKKSPFTIEWEEKEEAEKSTKEAQSTKGSNKSSKKGKLGKFIDKIAKPNEDEFVDPPEER